MRTRCWWPTGKNAGSRGGQSARGRTAWCDWSSRGDCIDCKACVVVCPAGIDIRDGSQLECIQCALCIDACDEIMDKIGRPRGLIAYDTIAMKEAKAAGRHQALQIAVHSRSPKPGNRARTPATLPCSP